MGQLRPGAKSSEKRMSEMLRVDHAGEYGATRIYQGQLAVLSKRGTRQASAETIRHMEAQEQVHLETFNRILNERQVRPTALTPIWHVAGFALGATTALMGEKAAMACTAAVEDVIDEHYQNQLDEIGEDETDLKATIAKFRDEEIEHHDIAIEQGAEQTPGYRILSNAIKAGTRLAIRLSEKV
ncbi:MAG: demethoxyubiquinone hydroxylase family protein [Alphaproteobacteria bacterium]|nr:MAG: demethoxyubiquinone hydroxylase family protein [Alphaproteobacteria bacterium]